MKMIELSLNENLLEGANFPVLLTNSKGIYFVSVGLNPTWEDMEITGVFQCGEVVKNVKPSKVFMPSSSTVYFEVPAEVMRIPTRTVFFGMVGEHEYTPVDPTVTESKYVVMPTQLIALGNLVEGAKLVVEDTPPTEPVEPAEPEEPETPDEPEV